MKKRTGHRRLSEEEKILWHKVGRTVTPLSARHRVLDFGSLPEPPGPAAEDAGEPEPAETDRSAIRSPAFDLRHQPPPAAKPATRPHIDRPTARKIAKGRISIDARIDLHEMTQSVAHDRLYAFLADCRSRGLRHVLVVTGKGRSLGSEGVLKRMVPLWLNGPPFADLVSGFSSAGRQHGGEGAIYIRLRKLARPDGSLRR